MLQYPGAINSIGIGWFIVFSGNGWMWPYSWLKQLDKHDLKKDH